MQTFGENSKMGEGGIEKKKSRDEQKEQVFASNSKFKIKRLRYQVTDNKSKITSHR